MRGIINYFKKLWARLNYQECYKESLGYRCQHRVYSDGFKECGGDR